MGEFEQWLAEKNLGDKTIRKHLSNIDLYINDFLNYYEITKMEDGIGMAFMFLDDWFIRKCLWSSKTSIKDTKTILNTGKPNRLIPRLISAFYACDPGTVARRFPF